MKADQDISHVPMPPPLMLLTSILVGVGLQFIFPIYWVSGVFRWFAGIALTGAGISIILYCAWMFKRAQTAIEPWKTTSRIVTHGPYRWTRNPIYLSFIVSAVGVAILADNLWIVLLQPVLMLVLTKVVIRREEKYLESKFGDSYREYKHTVRRWI